MTSRHCFFRVLREDFRHKIWMLALSTLGSLLALPVTWLIYNGERSQYLQRAPEDTVQKVLLELAYRNESFYGVVICCSAGAVALLGALIVGLFGFRYVFQRNMTDLYHSLPVSRKTLFAAGWLNGLLIWFVPYLVNLAVTLVLGEYRLSSVKRMAELRGNRSWEGWPSAAGLLINALISTLTILAAFLLVYHLVLLAVMLCGNLLNTLTVTGILGAGITIAWVISILLRQTYLDTFLDPWNAEFQWISYASPLVSAVCVLYQRVQFFAYDGYYMGRVAISFLTAAFLWLLAFAVYRRRRSELADQGLAGKTFRLILQALVSLAATFGGWLLFWYLGSYGDIAQLVWSVFGGILFGGVVFGVLDVIFNMDLKAFFRHKGLMAGVLAAGLFTVLTLRFDWMGYDEYLPDKEEIAEIAIRNDVFSNRQSYGDRRLLEEIHIRDREAAYGFLETAVALQRELDAQRKESYQGWRESVETKVTLRNGRSYYRRYLIEDSDSSSVYELVMKPEYLENCYRVSDGTRESFNEIELRRGSVAYYASKLTGEDRQRIEQLCDAYNRDLEENPEAVVRGEGRILSKILLRSSREPLRLTVYEGMSNTREALRRVGLAYYADPVDAEEVSMILLTTNISVRELEEEKDLAEHVREIYGYTVSGEEGAEDQEAEDDRMPAAEVLSEEASSRTEKGLSVGEPERELAMMDGYLELKITDPEEIAELLELISYSYDRAGELFGPRTQIYGRISIQEKNGNQYDVYMDNGTLPEKYILRFEQTGQKILEQRSR